MFVCENCGRIYEDVKGSREPHGEYTPDACKCGGAIVEAKLCKVGGEYMPEDEGDVCKFCLEAETSVENAILIGKKNREKVEINGFFTSILDIDDIEEILEAYVEQHFMDDSKEVKEYLFEDKDYFEDWIMER